MCRGFVLALLEQNVGEFEVVCGGPIFQPLSACVHRRGSELPDGLVVVVIGCGTDLCIAISANDQVHVSA